MINQQPQKNSSNPIGKVIYVIFLGFVESIKNHLSANKLRDVLHPIKTIDASREMKWISEYKKKNLIWIFSPIIMISLSIGLLLLSKGELNKNIFKKGATLKVRMAAIKSTSESYKMRIASLMFLSGLTLNIIGVMLNPVSRRTKELRKVVDGDDNISCWFPIGVYMDISGQSLTNVLANDKIWAKMNMRVNKNYAFESQTDRTKVVILNSFELKNMYSYDKVDID